MSELQLSAGPIEYEDTGGDGPVLVLLHGLTIDSSVWREVVPGLRADYRCITPTWPLGAHRKPLRPDADLSLKGLALLVGEFLERLDLRDVTLVLNDWGGGQILLSEGRADRVGRLVLAAVEAFDNYPPGIPGRAIGLACRVPGGLRLLLNLLRFKAFRRGPASWGWMSKRPVPTEVMDGWFRPATTSAEIRRDLVKYVTSVPPKDVLLDWAERTRSFERPVLVVWAKEDKLMPREHGRRLAELFPAGQLVEVDDSYTLIPEDQPREFVRFIREFVPAAHVPRKSG
ncbi:alpha/beta fold hydrolase [Amycolatopsis sp. H20-H5]|uniref:alpha/beta fold hydrolase n=1 Tax=Amycolatopsis sp. H20-H5 TaxID=3046309 RepID=UPI002DBA6311|nr:alpha/beta hydrolase [Amycolatopsis sp. H20-H5]MEC3976353.1 alpha/beta hydrolase [Amycolatopsis sp. H20-H5]